MKRRSFFGILFGGLLAKFLPKPKVDPIRVDMLDLSRWGTRVTQAENVTFDGCVIRQTDPSKPSFVTFDHGHPSTWGIKYYQTKEDEKSWLGLDRR